MRPQKKILNLTREQVRDLGQRLANKYKTKDVVMGLIGPLGAGKTAFVKDFASYLGIKKIKSPTFIIGSVHPFEKRNLYHYDFYRLNKISQLTPLGFTEILKSKNRIILIEWVDKFPQIAKQCDLTLTLEVTGKNLRNVTIR